MIKNKLAFIALLTIICSGATLLLLPMEYFANSIRELFMEYKWMDKASHFILFFTLTTFMYLSIKFKNTDVFLMMGSVALLAEFIQVLSVRSVSLLDGTANLIGVAASFLIIKYCVESKNKSESNLTVN